MRYLKYIVTALSVLLISICTMAQNDIVINEIMYNPSPDQGDDEYFEYVELVNKGDIAIDLSDWYFSEGFEFVFPVGTILGPGQYIVIAQDPDSIESFYGINNVIGPFISGALSNFGEDLELSDADDFVIDYVNYGTTEPWPVEPDGSGPSLELINPMFDNTIPQNWGASTTGYGTPGLENSNTVDEIITVVSPNGGEEWEQGTSQEIVWTSQYFNGNVTIDLITSGRNRETLIENTDNDGSWIWEIPVDQPAYDGYMIQISDSEDGFPIDQSDEPFSIIPYFTAPSLTITEIMYNPPEEGIDSLEYIEILNMDSETIDLEGYYFSSGISYTFPSIVLDSGEFAVVCSDSLAMLTTFSVMAYEWTDGVLDDSGELIYLNAPNGDFVDSVNYNVIDPWPADPNGNGPSLAFCDLTLDNSYGENWSAAYEYAGINQAGDTIYGSPGTLCLKAVEGVVITEIMYHPPNDDTDSLEFIEIYNNTLETIDLSGCKFTTGVDFRFPNVKINPASFIVVAQNLTHFLNSYGYPAYEWENGDLSNEGEIIELRDGLNNIIDMVPYESMLPWDTLAAGFGHSLVLCDPSSDNTLSWNWFAATEMAGVTSSNDTLYASPYQGCPELYNDIVVTEIMYNPPETGEDSLEYLEIYNKGTEAINLENYSLSNAVEFTFPVFDLAPGEYFLIANDSVIFETVFNKMAYQWDEGTLNNEGDTIELYDKDNILIDYIEYTSDIPWDTMANGYGPSLVLCNPFKDNSLPENWVSSFDAIVFNDEEEVIYGNPGSGCGEVPPLPDFTTINNQIGVGESINFYDQSYNDVDAWMWIFEGAEPDTSYDQNPIEIFYPEIGNYDVSLTVTNQFGSKTLLRYEYIIVKDTGSAPVADFIANDTIIPVGSAVNYTDLSTGVVDTWLWYFEGAIPDTSYEQNPSEIAYPQVGEFMVSLKVTNEFGESTLVKEEYISVGLPPICNFMASDTTIVPGAAVQFTDLSFGNPDAWEWVFEAGMPSSSSDQNPEVVYESTGDFTVGLIVYNEYGESSLVKEEYIHVSVGIDELSGNMIKLYPNPASDMLTVISNKQQADIVIYSMQGVMIHQSGLANNKAEIDIAKFLPGIYLVVITDIEEGIVEREILIIE